MKRWLVRKHISSGIDGGLDRGKTCKDKIEQPYALCVRVYYIHVKLLVVCNVPAGAVTGYLRLCWWEAVCPLSGWAWWLWLYSERSRGSAKLPHSACAYASGQLVRKNIGRFLFTRPKSKTFNHSKTRPATFLHGRHVENVAFCSVKISNLICISVFTNNVTEGFTDQMSTYI